MVNTTLKVSEETKKKLDKRKIHPRQSYDEVIEESLNLSGPNVIKGKFAKSDLIVNKKEVKK